MNSKLFLLRPLMVGALICMFWSLIAQPAFAFKLAPMVVEFAPRGQGATQSFQVENDSDEIVAVQISMVSRTIGEDGKETTTEAENDFSVFPPQFLIRPRQTQTVRVKWLGDSAPKQELSYRMIAEQLPVNVSKEKQEGNRINLLLRYIASIYIAPKGGAPKITLATPEPALLTNGAPGLALIFENHGTKHAVLRNLSVKLSAAGQTFEVPITALEGIAGANMLAGHKRRFVLPRPDALPEGPVSADFSFSQRK